MSRVVLILAGAVVSTSAFAAEPAWQGRGAIDPAACTSEGDTSETAPLYARATSLRWWVADCQIRKVTRSGAAYHFETRCASEGRSGIKTEIVLEPKGDKLAVVWDGSKVKDMKRCAQ